MGMGVGVVFLGIDYRDGRHVYDDFDRRGTLQDVYGAAHAHQDRANEFAAANLCHQFRGNVGRSEIGENEYVGAALQGAEGILLFDDLGRKRLVGHDFSVDDQGGVGKLDQFDGLSHLGANGMIDATETGERQHRDPGDEVEAARHVGCTERDLDQIFGGGLDVDAGIGEEEDFAFTRDDTVAAGNAVQ